MNKLSAKTKILLLWLSINCCIALLFLYLFHKESINSLPVNLILIFYVILLLYISIINIKKDLSIKESPQIDETNIGNLTYYCPKCLNLTSSNRCTFCHNKKTVTPEPNSIVHLITKETLWIQVVEDTLTEFDIKYNLDNEMISYMSNVFGDAMQQVKVYVYYKDYDKSTHLMNELF